MQSFTFNEWSTVATIFLSIVAIVIAIWSSRSTSKAAEKQICEIKNLSALQIDVTIKQLEAEIQKVMSEIKKSDLECKEIDNINKGAIELGPEYRNLMMHKHHASKPKRDLQIYSEYLDKLNDIKIQLKDLKRN